MEAVAELVASGSAAGGQAPRILVVEACTHHRTEDDIGTRKIPRIIRERIDARAQFDFVRGQPTAEALEGYDLAIACGACMATRGATLALDQPYCRRVATLTFVAPASLASSMTRTISPARTA